MKGIILAGGLGTRLYPLTKITNKHLLPVYDKPMIYYPIQTLVNAGIDEVLIVTGGNSAGDFMRLLENGREFGLKQLNYAYQVGEGGIAAALSLAEYFCDGDKMVVILGDNLIENNIAHAVRMFEMQDKGARIILKRVADPQRFGVIEFNQDCTGIIKIEEKPENPKSDYAVIGIYMYDCKVFDYIRKIAPSKRGELEITDVNNFYIEDGLMKYNTLEGWWTDAGTIDSLLYASSLVSTTGGANKIRKESLT